MKILGLGNALVDILVQLDNDDVLTKIKFPKGSMQLVDDLKTNEILELLKDIKMTRASGGSAANTIHGLGMLGAEAGYIGKVGKDEVGDFFSADIKKSGAIAHLLKSDTISGTALAMISKDSERTFATNLGAAVELLPDELSEAVFSKYDLFHLEGYIVMNHQLLEKSLKLAKMHNLQVSIDLASYNVVEDNLEFLQEMVEKYVDIVFANEEEAKAFTGKEPEEALNEIAKLCSIAVVKVGAKGSLVKSGNKTYKVEAIKTNSIDTTGAGDLYASGFLFGLSKNLSLDKCAMIGSLTASNIIQVIGAKLDDNKWLEIKRSIETY
jgi:sugar/nucleoside kinase (ribokinase family)